MRISKPTNHRCPKCGASDITRSTGTAYTGNDFETSVGVLGVYRCNTCYHSERYFIAREDIMKFGHKNTVAERWQFTSFDL
jgi:predicted RNA-binding Zn-ribbon protein involved in translation (DUF1610 family)